MRPSRTQRVVWLMPAHGGPHSRAARVLDFTGRALAAHRFAVFQPDLNGSAGYSQGFGDTD